MRRTLCIGLVLGAFGIIAPAAQAVGPPIVVGSWPSGVGAEIATMRAEINPNGLATTYLFEYTTEAEFRTKGFIGATKVPQTGVSIGNGLVAQRLDELTPDTAYRFRVIATNNLGIPKELQTRSFRTDQLEPIFALPDDRGWEMVSPFDKNGGDIQSAGANHGGGVLQAAGAGGRLTYTSASSFAGPLGSPGPNQYLSTRGSAGWSTENITLPMLSGTYPESPTSGVPYQLFSSDLQGALVSNGRRCRTSAQTQCPVENPPLPGSGAPAGYRNYYLRADSGTFKALLTQLPNLDSSHFELAFAGATPDLAHVVLSSCAAIGLSVLEVPGPEGECDPAKQNLYEVTGTQLRLINPTPGAALAAQSRAISADGSRVYWTDGASLYLSVPGSNKKVADGAAFQTASLDGSLAFYTAAGHLYRYTATSGASTDLAPSGGVTGMVGASEDGSFVYYLTAAGLFFNRNGAASSTLISSQADPDSAPPATGDARLSADGRRLLFLSTAELTAYDNRNVNTNTPEPELYLYAAPGTPGAGITCVSCNPSGERPIGAAEIPGASPNGTGALAPDVYKPRVLSADTKRVFFESFDSLAVSDTNGDRDVYQWEASGTGHCARPSGCIDLISSGRSEGGAGFVDASADGADAFFLTDGSLVSADAGAVDVYDARIGGGFPESTDVIPCFGDACQVLPSPPIEAELNSLRSKPSGNAEGLKFKSLHCKKNQVKKLGRCVKKKSHKKKRGGKTMSPRRPRAPIAVAVVTAMLAALALAAPAAQAAFGFLPGEAGFKATAIVDAGGAPATLAGAHPYSLVTEINFNKAGNFSDGDLKDLTYDLPPGLIENATSVPRCGAAQFTTPRNSPYEVALSGESCSGLAQIGTITLESSHAGGETRTFGVFNLAPPPGSPSRLGFSPYGEPVTIAPRVREAGREYGLTLDLDNFTQILNVSRIRLEIWGTPFATAHDGERGNCLNEANPSAPHALCPVSDLNPPHPARAYLTLPSNCSEALDFHLTATSWQQPNTAIERSWTSGAALTGCDKLTFNPIPRGQLSTERASSPSGYDFTLDGTSAPLLNPSARASSQAKKAVVTLPEGMSVNPSVGSGLGTCSEAQFANETVTSAPGAGCPNESKIGELTIESPLVEEQIEGSMFFATPNENRFGTLVALYMVAKDPDRGILVKVAGRVDSDPLTGQLTTTFDDLPQLPYSHFNVHFREGQRSPLATPSACGTYATEVDTSPWLDPSITVHASSPFVLSAGPGGGPCQIGPLAPFAPGATGGVANGNASSYTPFNLHLTRSDGEQEITSYSAVLPPGELGKIAGVPFCPENLIEAAKAQTGAESEIAPACPAASLIGHTYTGYGVGQSLAYAPGTLYLAGPYHGSPLSVVAIDSAKVGPFDLGTVVIRSAIRIDKQTARVAIDSAGSDPIPHILKGFPLRLRDIRVDIDKPNFMVNPTNCDPFSLTSTLTGSGLAFGDPADDQSSTSSVPFQVSNCSALDFTPKLAIALSGGHKRGVFPALRATVTANEGDANIGSAIVTLPPRLFLAQEHLESVCTPRQFAAHSCPKESIYGTASATTPLLETPLSGNVYLRTNNSERALPDLVADLSGRGIEIEVLGKIDSYKGGMRARFDGLPDAPVSKFTMSLKGNDHGLIVNATDICLHPQTATAKFVGQENTARKRLVPLNVKCGKGKKKRKSVKTHRSGQS